MILIKGNQNGNGVFKAHALNRGHPSTPQQWISKAKDAKMADH